MKSARLLRTAIVLLLMAGRSSAIEKYWIAHEATLIVVGTMHPDFTFPWFDGWHMTGTIVVDEVLYGRRPARDIKIKFVCGCGCQSWPPPRFTGQLTEKGLWFLRPLDQQTWQFSIGCPYIGFELLSQRSDFENYIRLYKQ